MLNRILVANAVIMGLAGFTWAVLAWMMDRFPTWAMVLITIVLIELIAVAYASDKQEGSAGGR